MNNIFVELTPNSMRYALANLAHQLPKDAFLWPVARGGHVICAMLQYYRNDLTLRWGEYQINSKCIIVDDIVDTGITLAAKANLGWRIATLLLRDSEYTDPIRLWEPQYSGMRMSHDNYVTFPWEPNPKEEKEAYLKRLGDLS